jgi:hypothetical protein
MPVTVYCARNGIQPGRLKRITDFLAPENCFYQATFLQRAASNHWAWFASVPVAPSTARSSLLKGGMAMNEIQALLYLIIVFGVTTVVLVGCCWLTFRVLHLNLPERRRAHALHTISHHR